jgi:dTDP-glucose 4,6-dehydratase|tara:strand:+ start:320 stop:1276 length:957 start_codon:yes stop_codon:yes gene_type:complete
MLTSLITGGAGFLGSHLCEKLLSHGHKVICFDSLLTGRESNISRHSDNPNFEFIQGTVTEFINIPDNIDYLLHFASPASPKDYRDNPIHTLKAGSIGTHNVLGLARAKKARVLLASTSEIYGDPLESPQKESYWGNVNPVGPRSVYDEAKRFSEAITMAYYREHNIDVRIARIFNCYGPRMRPDDGRAVPNFFIQALKNDPITIYGEGLQTRSFCYVTDLVDALLKLLMISDDSMTSLYERIFNIGGTEEITVLGLAEIIKIEVGSSSEIKFHSLPEDDPMVRKPDISRAERLLEWSPKVTLKEGISISSDWFNRYKK